MGKLGGISVTYCIITLLFCRLVVVSNNIRGKGLCALADIMKVNSSLVSLFIWGNVLEESACIVSNSMWSGIFFLNVVEIRVISFIWHQINYSPCH